MEIGAFVEPTSRQHFLYFFPLPQGQESFLEIFIRSGRLCGRTSRRRGNDSGLPTETRSLRSVQPPGRHSRLLQIYQLVEDDSDRDRFLETLAEACFKTGWWSFAQRRCRESEDRVAVANGNDGQQTMGCQSIVDGDSEPCDVLPEAGQETPITVNCAA